MPVTFLVVSSACALLFALVTYHCIATGHGLEAAVCGMATGAWLTNVASALGARLL